MTRLFVDNLSSYLNLFVAKGVQLKDIANKIFLAKRFSLNAWKHPIFITGGHFYYLGHKLGELQAARVYK